MKWFQQNTVPSVADTIAGAIEVFAGIRRDFRRESGACKLCYARKS
jgi:hypothetical protein